MDIDQIILLDDIYAALVPDTDNPPESVTLQPDQMTSGDFDALISQLSVTEIVVDSVTVSLDAAQGNTPKTLSIVGESQILGVPISVTLSMTGDTLETRRCAVTGTWDAEDTFNLNAMKVKAGFGPDDWNDSLFTTNLTGVTLTFSATTLAIAGSIAFDPAKELVQTPNISVSTVSVSLERVFDPNRQVATTNLTFSANVNVGGFAVTIALKPQLKGGLGAPWKLSVTPTAQNGQVMTLQQAIELFANNFTNALPPRLEPQWDVALRSIEIVFRISPPGIISASLTLTFPGPWSIIDNLRLRNITLTAKIGWPGPTFGFSARGEVAFGTGQSEQVLQLYLNKAAGSSDWVVGAQTAPDQSINLEALTELPGGPSFVTIPLPSGISPSTGLKVDECSLTVRPTSPFLMRIGLDVALTGTLNIVQGWLAVTEPRFELNIEAPFGRRSIDARFSGAARVADLVNIEFSMALSGGRWEFMATLVDSVNLGDLMDNLSLAEAPAATSPISLAPIRGLTVTQLHAEFRTRTPQSAGELLFAIVVSTNLEIDLAGYPMTVVNVAVSFLARWGAAPTSANTSSKVFEVRGAFRFDVGENRSIDMVGFVVFSSATEPRWRVGVEFLGIRGEYRSGEGGQPGKFVISIGERTVGELIDMLLNLTGLSSTLRLPPEWSFISGISLGNMQFEIYPSTCKVGAGTHFARPINLGFFTVTGVYVYFEKSGASRKISVKVEGYAAGMTPGAPFEWELGQRGPEMPGNASKLLDLRFLAIGQRLKLTDTTKLRTVTDTIDEMARAFTPSVTGDNPLSTAAGLEYDAKRNWILGADFTVLGFLALGFVFNDGILAGMRLGVSGTLFPQLSGLNFEILYKKVSESVGVYQIELRVPDAFRQFDLGQVSITLPVIAVDIYTNGNFRVDLGFPRNNDFSRSFGLSVLPFLGAGGFYFALLEGQTASRLPSDYNPRTGVFKPVIEFGIGLSIGVGKIIDKGIFRAELSLTVQGILEGVIAFFNGHAQHQVPSGKYFWLQGTLSLVGRLQGSVSFAVISANVLVEAYARARVTFESYRPILITFSAGVNVALKVRVGSEYLGFDVDYSYSTEISETFEIESPERGTAPWALTVTGHGLPAHALPAGRPKAAEQEVSKLRWLPISRDANKEFLWIAFRPQFTVAQCDPVVSECPQGCDQLPHAVGMLFLDGTPIEGAEFDVEQLEVCRDPRGYNDFDRLAEAVLLWSTAAYKKRDTDEDDVPDVDVADLRDEWIDLSELKALYRVLALQPYGGAPFDAYAVTEMLKTYFWVRLWAPDGNRKILPVGSIGSQYDYPTVIPFPMIPELKLDIFAVGDPTDPDNTAIAYDPIIFENNAIVSPEYHDDVAEYFAMLAMQFQNELEKRDNPRSVAPDPDNDAGSDSMAGYIFTDYFLMIARGMVQGAMDSITGTFGYTSAPGDDLYSISRSFLIPLGEVVEACQEKPLVGGVQGMTGGSEETVVDGDCFASIVARFDDTLVQDLEFIEEIGDANAFTEGLIAAGLSISYGDLFEYVVLATDTLYDLIQMADPGTNPGKLALYLAFTEGTLEAGATIFVPVGLPVHVAESEESYAAIGGEYADSPTDVSFFDPLADLNAFTPGILATNSVIILDGDASHLVQPGDTLASIAATAPGNHTPAQILRYYRASVGVLPAGARLRIPPVPFSVAANATLKSVADDYGVDPEWLVLLNPTLTWEIVSGTPLTLRNANRMQIGMLTDRAMTEVKVKQLGGMVSRFILPGLRLPRPSDDDDAADWGNADSRPLYALTGQQFALPRVVGNNATDEVWLRLGPQDGPDAVVPDWFDYFDSEEWIEWAQTHGPVDSEGRPLCSAAPAGQPLPEGWHAIAGVELVIPTTVLRNYTDCADAPLRAKLAALRKAPLFNVDPADFALGRRVRLRLGTPIPGLTVSDDVDGYPRMWTLGNGLLHVIGREWAVRPSFDLMFHTQFSNGGGATGVIGSARWVLTLDLRVRRVKLEDGSTLPTTYEIDGVDPEGAQRLEQLLAFAGGQGNSIAQVQVLYPDTDSAPTPTYSSDPVNDIGLYIVRANLSTLSNPQASKGMQTQKGMPTTIGNDLNTDPVATLRTIWQASVVRSGGYYLYYRSNARSTAGVSSGHPDVGLPEALFSQEPSAVVTLLVIVGSNDPGVPAFVNRAVIGDRIHPEAVVRARSSEGSVSITLNGTQTLAEALATRSVTAEALVNALTGQRLIAGTPVLIEGCALYAGGNLTTWADFEDLTGVPAAEIAAFNNGGGVGPNDGELVALPVFEYGVVGSPTLGELADFFAIPAASILFANADRAIFVGATINVVNQLYTKTSAVPVGHTGVQIYREPVPGQLAPWDNSWAEQQLDFMYHLATFQVQQNGWFAESNWSLTLGPGNDTQPYHNGLSMPAGYGTLWKYEQILPVFPLLQIGPGVDGSNPYRGVGSWMEVGISWRDGFGNDTCGEECWRGGQPPQYTYTCGALTAMPHLLPLHIGYTDELIGLERWPSLSAGFVIHPDATDGPQLYFEASFSASRYVVEPHPENDPYDGEEDPATDRAKRFAEADLAIYRRVYHQLDWGDNDVWLSSSLDDSTHTFEPADYDELKGVVATIIDYLDTLRRPETEMPNAAGNPITFSIRFPVSIVGNAAIMPLTTRFGVRRNGPVDEGFVDVPGAREVVAEIAPIVDERILQFTTDTTIRGSAGSLRSFAGLFQATFAGAKVAVSQADTANADSNSRNRLWVVRFGANPAIEYAIDVNDQSFFAPPPLATFLLEGRDFEVQDYIEGALASPARKVSYSGIDLDKWARTFLSAVDTVLLPQNAVPARMLELGGSGLCNSGANRCLQKIIDAKATIARAIAWSAESVYSPETGQKQVAQDQLEQQLLVRLSAAYETDAMVQLGVNVTSTPECQDEAHAPKLYGRPVVEEVTSHTADEDVDLDGEDPESKTPEFTFSTTRIPLVPGPSHLTFAFRSEKAKQEQNFDVKANFLITALEHEIRDVPGAGDYRASTWLTFVLPFPAAPTLDLHIPVPIRSYPVPPALIKQAVGASNDLSQPRTLPETREWKYEYQYDRTVGGKDTVYSSFRFNVPKPPPHTMKVGGLDLFQALARFINAWEPLQSELFTALPKVRPGADSVDLTKAERSLAVFSGLVADVAAAWPDWANRRGAYQPAAVPDEGNALFSVTEINHNGDLKVLVKKCKGEADLRVPKIELDNYRTEENGSIDENPDPATDERVFYFQNGVGERLTFADAAAISRRTFRLVKLDIFNRQNVWAGVYMTRNEALVEEAICVANPPKKTNPVFVYKTPLVQFSTPLTPYLFYQGEIDIAGLAPALPRKRPIASHIAKLFESFFATVVPAEGASETRTIRVDVNYYYLLDGVACGEPLHVKLPVVLAPPFEFDQPVDQGSDCNAYPAFVCRLAESLQEWFTARSPVPDEGKLVFDITMFSGISGTQLITGQLPVYELNNLVLWADDIDGLNL